MLAVPPKKQANSFRDFVDLPVNDKYCSAVDMKYGMWYDCSLCKCRVKVRTGRAYTTARWNDHTSEDSSHARQLKNSDCVAELRKKKKEGKVSLVCFSYSYQHLFYVTFHFFGMT